MQHPSAAPSNLSGRFSILSCQCLDLLFQITQEKAKSGDGDRAGLTENVSVFALLWFFVRPVRWPGFGTGLLRWLFGCPGTWPSGPFGRARWGRPKRTRNISICPPPKRRKGFKEDKLTSWMTFCCWTGGNLYARSGKVRLLKTSGRSAPSVGMMSGLVCCCYVWGWRSRCGAASYRPPGTNTCPMRKRSRVLSSTHWHNDSLGNLRYPTCPSW